MDTSCFMEDTFSVKEWVNGVLTGTSTSTPSSSATPAPPSSSSSPSSSQASSSPSPSSPGDLGSVIGSRDPTSTEAQASGLSLRLQVMCADVLASVHDASLSSLSLIPSSLVELDQTRREVELLRSSMEKRKENLDKLSQLSDKGLGGVLSLVTMRNNMTDVLTILQHATTLTTLKQSSEKILQNADLDEITKHCSDYAVCVKGVEGLSIFEEEQKQLTALHNTVVQIFKAQICTAINSKDTASSQMYTKAFAQMGLVHQIEGLYIDCLCNKWCTMWTDVKTTNASQKLVDWLPLFYDSLVSALTTEVMWASQVFLNGHAVLAKSLSRAFSIISPMLKKLIEDSTNVNQPLDSILALYTISVNFTNITTGILSPAFNAQNEGTIGEPGQLVVALLGAYKEMQTKYAQLERTQLLTLLEPLKPLIGGGSDMCMRFHDTIHRVGGSIPPVLQTADAAIHRCLLFTSGSQLPALTTTLQDYFGEYLQHLMNVLGSLKAKTKLDLDSRSLQDSSFNWSVFTSSLQLLQVSSQLLSTLDSFNNNFVATVVAHKQFVLNAQSPSTPLPSNQLAQSKELSFYVPLPLEPQQHRQLQGWFMTVEDRTSRYHMLHNAVQLAGTFVSAVKSLAYDTVMSFVDARLSTFPGLEEWKVSKNPNPRIQEFTNPLSYITSIGELLITLPQHLEPFAAACEGTGTRKDGDMSSFSPQFIATVCRQTMTHFIQKLSEISLLGAVGSKQLAVDIGYILKMICALGVTPLPTLALLQNILNANAQQQTSMVHTVMESSNDQTLISLLRKLKIGM
ncbi:conserved oligomeric Golgi complex subunit 7 [Pelomyxa schiedti]|nr:conserved oligomeric Golgi complex subunit 7 [Pelomyxa schiedti]